MNADTTMAACFAGSASQAAVNNLAPLLFTVFQAEFGIPLASITLLITLNFSVQLCVDLASVWIVKRFGCRISIVAANLLCGIGLVLMCLAGYLQKKGPVRQSLLKKPLALQWAVEFSLLFCVIILGAYGTGYVAVDPIYGKF